MENFENEIWKSIKDYEGLYEVSNYGRIKSLEKSFIIYRGGIQKRKQKIKNLQSDKYGYNTVALSKNSLKKTYKVHRLVAISFLEKPDDLDIINHKNGIKNDNRVENLEWCNNSLNQLHAIENNLRKPPSENQKKIVSNKLKNRKFSEEHKLKIGISKIGKKRTNYKPKNSVKVIDNSTGIIYESIFEASKQSKYSATYLQQMLSGKYKNKTTLKIL